MVFVGSQGAPATASPTRRTPRSRRPRSAAEKPFLYVDAAGAYQVFVPGAADQLHGHHLGERHPGRARSLPIDQFYVVKPGDTAADINAALAAGKNLLFTPGVYHLNQTLKVTRPDTVVLGLGLATLMPDNGVTAMKVADVDGVKVAGCSSTPAPPTRPR